MMSRALAFAVLTLVPMVARSEMISIAGCRLNFNDFSIVSARGSDLQMSESRAMDICSQQISSNGCCHLMASAETVPASMCLAVFGIHSQAEDRIVRYVDGVNEDEPMSYGQAQDRCIERQAELGLANSSTCVFVGTACGSFYTDEGTPASELP